MNWASSSNGHSPFRISYSQQLRETIESYQREASLQGRGQLFRAAFQTIVEKLQFDPIAFGEPLYRLPALDLQVRCAAIGPIYIDFAVSAAHRIVYLRTVRLLDMPAE